MPVVAFTHHLNRYFPDLRETEVPGGTLAEVVHNLARTWPGLPEYIVDERGKLRKHVNIFVGDDRIDYTDDLTAPLPSNQKVFIFQALSGG